MDFVSISSTGDATDFGDATTSGTGRAGVSNGTRGVHMSSKTPTNTNIIDYISIAETGNAQDFGDLIGGWRLRDCQSSSWCWHGRIRRFT